MSIFQSLSLQSNEENEIFLIKTGKTTLTVGFIVTEISRRQKEEKAGTLD